MMHLIWMVLIGFLAGLVARAVTPGSGPTGFFLTAGLGILGSVVATFLGEKLGMYHVGDAAGFIASVVGAVLLLVIYNLVNRRSS